MITAEQIRNANWQQIQDHLAGDRQRVWHMLRRLGPCSTQSLAERSGFSILSVRPRVTELAILGLAELVGTEGRHGIYRGVPVSEARAEHIRRQQAAAAPQEQLALI